MTTTTKKKYIQDYREYHDSPVRRIEIYWDKKQENWRWSMGEFDMIGFLPMLYLEEEGRCQGRMPAINAARKAAREWVAAQK